MCVVTEDEIRKRISEKRGVSDKEIVISKKDILTPSAKSYLIEKNITIKYTEEQVAEQVVIVEVADKQPENIKNEEIPYEYETIFGMKLQEKPEHMTHLRGNLLVFKDHPRIALRGKIDSLESEIIVVQLLAEGRHMNKLVKELQEVILFIRNLLRCEVSGERIDTFTVAGLTPEDMREQSYHPSKYFGMRHVLPSYTQGEIVAGLNRLRTMTRETELVAYKAFKDEYGAVERNDIIKAFNRLSSLFWIMMFKVMTDKYKE
ncbi:MAG: cobalamin adenosyltransferase [Cellulosilyticaceae bacterium]